MGSPPYVLAHIVRQFRDAFMSKHQPPGIHLRVLDAIANCRTAALGGHADQCDTCGHIRISYNSCRNRHCPKCQGTQRERWIAARQQQLLPVRYFHVVFTLPQELNVYCLHYPTALYNLMFACSKATIETFAADTKHLGAIPGYNKPWVVYAKQPFGGPQQVIEYLGGYSHKVAISNHRITHLADGTVSFRYKDYADGCQQKQMTLDATEFLHRFCLHILPKGFRKIRHYGFLSNRCRQVFKKQ